MGSAWTASSLASIWKDAPRFIGAKVPKAPLPLASSQQGSQSSEADECVSILVKNTPGNITSHMLQSSDHRQWVLLTTCQIWVIASDGSTTVARALLDLMSSTSFVVERLKQCLHLQHQYRHTQISGISGITAHLSLYGVVSLKVSPTTCHGKSCQWKQWSFLK